MQHVRPKFEVPGGEVRVGVRTASSAFLASELQATRSSICDAITQYLQATEERSSPLRLDQLVEYTGSDGTLVFTLDTKIRKHEITTTVTIVVSLDRPADPSAELEIDQLVGPTITASITAILVRDVKHMRRLERAAA